MIIHDFTSQSSLLQQFISELRDVSIQKDAMRFRRNIERVGEILSYECSKELQNTEENIINSRLISKRASVLNTLIRPKE